MSVPAGGNQNYQGLGYFSTPPDAEPPKQKRTALMVALVVAAVLIAGVTVTLLVVDTTKQTPGQALAAPQSSTQPRTPTTSSGTSNDPLRPQATGAPQVPGWKPIAIDNGGDLKTTKAYDVPPNWKPLGINASFGKDSLRTSLYIPAIYLQGYCPSSPTSFRSMSGLILVDNKGSNAEQAVAGAQRMADAVFSTEDGVKPKVDMGPPQPITVAQSKKGIVVNAKATIAASTNEKDKCNAASAVLSVMALEPVQGDDSSVVLVAFGDQGFPEATPEQQLQQIVTSIHSAN